MKVPKRFARAMIWHPQLILDGWISVVGSWLINSISMMRLTSEDRTDDIDDNHLSLHKRISLLQLQSDLN